jgi:hypothetical protein
MKERAMFITKKHLSRRTVLRGAGAAIALPLLDAMLPAATALANTAARPPLRMGFVFFPHGAVIDNWSPKAAGTDFEISPILAPLERHREQLTIISGTRNRPAESADPHGIVERTWLSCVAPPEAGRWPDAGVTADQIAARHIGQDTPLPSLETTTEGRSSLAWRTPTQPLPMENNPRTLFYRLFGQGDTAEERAAIVAEQASILDRVQAQTARFRRELGAPDRVMLDDYLDSVREVERRVDNMLEQDFSALDIPEAPIGVPGNFDPHLRLMFDLIALAFQADLTRVATFHMAREISMRTYNNLGISEAFHPLSHHGRNPADLAKLTAIQNYHTDLFARFLDRLAATPEGDGTVLDHSMILYGSNMSDSDRHNQDPLPVAILGRAHGRIRGGQHLVYPQNTRFSNVLLTMFDRADIPVESIGDSTEPFSQV